MFEKISENLKKLGYSVSCFENKADASKYINAEIDKKTVGFGGSMTLEEMGLYDTLKEHNDVYWHWKEKGIIDKANSAQIYLSSVNGLAETGEIINIDGNCNRIASILYGHEKVYLIAGKNKIAEDYEKALSRARNVAAPLNAMRLGADTPCAKKGDKCYDCKRAGRICRGLSVMWAKPMAEEFEVILINENLGY